MFFSFFFFLRRYPAHVLPLNQGPNLFYVDSDGTRLKHHLFSVGSGSTFAYGILDSMYKFDMSVEVRVDL